MEVNICFLGIKLLALFTAFHVKFACIFYGFVQTVFFTFFSRVTKGKSRMRIHKEITMRSIRNVFSVMFLFSQSLSAQSVLTEREKTLLWATERGNVQIMQRVLEKRVDLEARNKYGRTALQLAAEGDIPGVIRVLLREGADTEVRTVGGRTVLHLAAYRSTSEVIEIFLNAGVVVEARDMFRKTALHWATANSPEVVSTLLDNGAVIGARDENGWTVLHEAAYWGDPEVIEVLLKANADIKAKDFSGKTALDIAKQHNQDSAVKAIRRFK